MTVLLDDRGGAKQKDDAKYYPGQLNKMIPDSILTRLDTGDVAFSGRDGIMIGIELKRVTDALSCIFNSRLADTQLPAMAQAYDVRYLIIQDLYRADPETGVLQRWVPFKSDVDVKCGRWFDVQAGRNRVTYTTFELWLHTMSELGQARLERTIDLEGTAALIKALYAWWSRNDHKSFNVMYEGQAGAAPLTRPGMLQRQIAFLPRVGWSRSTELVKRVGSVKFFRKDGKPMEINDWLIPDEIAEGTAMKIMEACDGQAD